MQSFTDFELILIDDGSPDECPKICDIYAQKDKRIIVIHKKNAGLSAARNDGIRKSSGKFIVLLDGDDLLSSYALQEVYNIIKDNSLNTDIIINRYQLCDDDSKLQNECSYSFDLQKLRGLNATEIYRYCINLPGFLSTAWTLVCRRDYLIKNSIFFADGLMHEDELWTPQVILNASLFCYNNNIFYFYRNNRAGSIMNKVNIQKVFDKLHIIDNLLIESDRNSYTNEAAQVLRARCIALYYSTFYDYVKYKKIRDMHIDKLAIEISKRRYILLLSKNIKYYIIWIILMCFRVSITSDIIVLRMKIKRSLLSNL